MKTITLKEEKIKDYFSTEAYRTLRTNMQFCGSDVKCIALTSCMPNEGKTTIAFEMAKSFAEVGKKVLLIDADLRKSVAVRKYTTEMGVVGLSRFLSGQATEDEVIFHTQYPGFDIIFAGQYPPNPVELLSGLTFRKLIEDSKSVYDYVLIDTPPLGMVIDCAVVAGICDSALMVVSVGKIHRVQAIEVKEQLERSGVRILGVILNHNTGKRIDQRKKKEGSRYYYAKKSDKTESGTGVKKNEAEKTASTFEVRN